MNILKTNRLGIIIAKQGFIGRNEAKRKRVISTKDSKEITINTNLLRHNPRAKIIRVSKNIIETCRMIDIKSIKDNIDTYNFDFKSMFILLPDDKLGVIKVERYGSDLSFLWLSGLNITYAEQHLGVLYNTYSFASKSFGSDKEDVPNEFMSYDKSIFVVQLLTYLIFGDITERFLKPKASLRINSTRFLNNSKLNITFCDSLWKQRINVEGFKVRGHFRLQPVGEGRCNRKLIWIEEFDKKGYNRRATVELIK
jgi:hypothetical protein